jgi:hypothetical protein
MYHIYFGDFGNEGNFYNVSECTRESCQSKSWKTVGGGVKAWFTMTYMNIRLKSKKSGYVEHDSCVIHELGMQVASCELSGVVATCRMLRVYHVSYFSSFHTM